MIKLMHMADIHLDSPFSGLGYTESVRRRGELREVFMSAVTKAKEAGVSVILLAGDLFDKEFCTRDTLDFLFSVFAGAKDIRFVISPGNHDPYVGESPYKAFGLPENREKTENVFVFRSPEISAFEFPDLGLTVAGWAFDSRSLTCDPLEGYRAPANTRSVLCAHADITSPFSTYAPVAESSIAASGLDYAAFGHLHTYPEIKKAGNTTYAYSGCLAGRDFSEYGEKGVITVTLSEENGERCVRTERITLCPWKYSVVGIDVSETSSNAELADKIRTVLSGREREIVRVELSGNCGYDPDTEKLLSELKENGVAEIIVNVSGTCGYEALGAEFGIRGEFFRELKPDLESDDPKKRRVALAALKIGLKALDGREFS